MFRYLLSLSLVTIGISLGVFEFFYRDFLSRLFLHFDLIDYSFLVISTIFFLIAAGVLNHNRIKTYRFGLYTFSIFTFTFIITAVLISFQYGEYQAAALFISGGLAAAGWLLGHLIAIYNHRKQHTLNILLQMRQSDIFESHRVKVFSRVAPYEVIFADDVPSLFAERTKDSYAGGDAPVIDSMLYMLNYYEFISAGMLEGDIDVKLINETLKPIMINLYKKMASVITFMRNTDIQPFQNQSAFDNYLTVLKKWGIEVQQ